MEAGGPGEEAAKAQADAIRERGEETEDRLEDAAGGWTQRRNRAARSQPRHSLRSSAARSTS